MMTLNIQRIAKLRGVERPYTFLVRQGFTNHSAKKLLSGQVRRLDLVHLEKLCRVFLCEPHDLLDYTRSAKEVMASTDHLGFLAKPKMEGDMQAMMSRMTMKEVEALSQDMAKRLKEEGSG